MQPARARPSTPCFGPAPAPRTRRRGRSHGERQAVWRIHVRSVGVQVDHGGVRVARARLSRRDVCRGFRRRQCTRAAPAVPLRRVIGVVVGRVAGRGGRGSCVLALRRLSAQVDVDAGRRAHWRGNDCVAVPMRGPRRRPSVPRRGARYRGEGWGGWPLWRALGAE
eukprot:scaffold16716_cov134-Isochrysis_galbana.AAC.4